MLNYRITFSLIPNVEFSVKVSGKNYESAIRKIIQEPSVTLRYNLEVLYSVMLQEFGISSHRSFRQQRRDLEMLRKNPGSVIRAAVISHTTKEI